MINFVKSGLVFPISILAAPLFLALWTVIGNFHEVSNEFAYIWADPDLIDAVLLSARFSLVTTVSQIVVGLIVAILVPEYVSPKAFVFTCSIVFLPYIVPSAISVLSWKLGFKEIGVFSELLLWFEPESFRWLNQDIYKLMTLFSIWQYVPFVFLFCIANLKEIPRPTMEAMRLDTNNIIKKSFYIYIPILEPILKQLLILRLLFMLNKLEIPILFGALEANGQYLNVLSILSLQHATYTELTTWSVIFFLNIFVNLSLYILMMLVYGFVKTLYVQGLKYA